jgi:SlyX protein
MDETRLERLEERLAWLERHVVEQDKAMLEQSETLDRLTRELLTLRERAENAPPPLDPHERPPHY